LFLLYFDDADSYFGAQGVSNGDAVFVYCGIFGSFCGFYGKQILAEDYNFWNYVFIL
jgi:hypothetical protein